MEKIVNIIKFEQEVYITLGKTMSETCIFYQRTQVKHDILCPTIMDFTYSLQPYFKFFIYKN
jgi:hypothetical protein